MTASARSEAELREANRRFYDPLWSDARLVEPDRFNTWPMVCSLIEIKPRETKPRETKPHEPARLRLEVAPGLRPRLPLEDTCFVDISAPAVAKLRARGANAVRGLISALPFPDRAFELVCSLDVVEHVDDDDGALAELSRVAAPGAALLLSVPLHPSHWSAFDDFVGHRRRYEPERLLAKLAAHGLRVVQSAAYGMRPQSSRLVDIGMWFLVHRRERAMWWYNRVFMPFGLRSQKKLAFVPGMISSEQVDEIVMVCHKQDNSQRGRAS